MTKQEYDSLNKFPVDLVSTTRYEAKTNGQTTFRLRKGDVFIGIRKETFGKDDYSIIDELGHMHHYSCCDVLFKDGA